MIALSKLHEYSCRNKIIPDFLICITISAPGIKWKIYKI